MYNIFLGSEQVTNFSSVFQSCSSLTSIPVGLFGSERDIIEFDRKILSEVRKKKLEKLKMLKNN